ncbi:uncharacterized protein [Eurosta solidaginis]|uniref:uncharacterized protein n=1 Tax=Eurosta solidaginis TaxID=178769 RepID=UPI003530B6A3
MEKISASKKKVRVSKAQQNKNYIAKLKSTGKSEEYKKKRAASTKLYRRKKKNEENQMPQTTISSVLEKRRENIRQRVQKFREKMRTGEKRSRSVLSDTQLTGYNCSQTFGKAVRKAERALPQSPTKRKAVLTKIFSNVREANKMDMETSILPPQPQKKIHQNILMLKKAIIAFYERDDISRVSPRVRDVKEYLSESGEKILLPTRHMVLSCREACALFNEEQGNSGKDTCGITFFLRHRPDHVKLIKELPHNMCLCSYHANFIDAVSALHKFVAHVSDYENGFVLQFLCDIPSMGCWYGECVKYTGITVPKLTALVGEADLDMQVSWMKWTKNDGVNRTERRQKSGKLTDLVAYISGLSAQFLIHSFNKCEQSEVFNVHDRPRALSVNYAVEGLLQVDFAENFVCENQDEVQSAHWNQRQLSIFTSGLYYNETFTAKVLVSNNLSHTKDTIVPYLYILFKNLPSTVRILKMWSDGPSSQFKNKYIAALIPHFEEIFGMKIVWNYFATSHGKGCVDGIGATIKTIVRKHVRARDIVVNNASDFVQAVHMTPSKIMIEEVTSNQIEMINAELQVVELFSRARPIQNISSAHQIQVRDNKIATFKTSRQGYN